MFLLMCKQQNKNVCVIHLHVYSACFTVVMFPIVLACKENRSPTIRYISQMLCSSGVNLGKQPNVGC